MRLPTISNCERTFFLNSFVENLRVDGRRCDEFRQVKLTVGIDAGSCIALCGRTKVFTQVSCAIKQPKSNRGNEGEIFVNVEMSPMGSSSLEMTRQGWRAIELTRIMERLFKESHCIDTESMCLKSNEKVWQIRIDVHIIDFDGGLLDCACMSAITALAHFRRPDCTVTGDVITIHDADERDLVPLNIYHMPVCVSFGLTENGNCVIVDPTEGEELCLEGVMVVGANKRQEICALHASGSVALNKQLISKCMARAVQRADDICQLINTVIMDDREKRGKGKISGFSDLISLDLLSSNEYEPNVLLAPSVSARRDQQGRTGPPCSWRSDSKSEAVITVKNKAVHLGERKKPLMVEKVTEDEANSLEKCAIVEELTNAVAKQSKNESEKASESKRPRKFHHKVFPQHGNLENVDDLLGDIVDDIIVLNADDIV